MENYYSLDYRTKGCYGSDVADAQKFPLDNLFYFNRGESAAHLLSQFTNGDRLRILDIGAGYGHILHSLGQRFPDSERHAIEFSDVCVQHLESLGLSVTTQPVETILPTIGKKFDVIVLSHVLEHLLSPKSNLELIRSCLVPRGLLYIEVPNIPLESLHRYPDNVWAPRFDEPHVTFFSVNALSDLLKECGFTQRFCDTAGPEYQYISALRYSLPPLRSTILSWMPAPIFRFLRRQRSTASLRVKTREDSFYQYGGFRIWIRSVWQKLEAPAP